MNGRALESRPGPRYSKPIDHIACARAGEGSDMGIDVNRERAIDLALSQIEKQFGKGAIMKLGEGGVIADIPALPTGSLGLDIALGIGGMPRGRVVEIH